MLLPVLAALLSGCASDPLLFGLMTKPETTEFRHTPVGTKSCVLSSYKVREPVSGYGVSAEWDASHVKAAALKAGITNVYFTDMKTLSVLGGIYRQRMLIVYGD